MTTTRLFALLAFTSACHYQVRTHGFGTTEPVPPEPTVVAAAEATPAPEPVVPPPAPPRGECQWQAALLGQEHMGGGAYTDPYIAPDENYDLNARLRIKEKFAERRKLDVSRHIDCSRLKRVRGSSGLLAIARKTGPKREDVTYLAAEYFQATNWMVNYENGQPVTRTKVVILYFRPNS